MSEFVQEIMKGVCRHKLFKTQLSLQFKSVVSAHAWWQVLWIQRREGHRLSFEQLLQFSRERDPVMII